MNLLPYFKWYPSDAESDAKYAAMNIAERGLYHSALNYAWMNDGLPADGAEVARVLRVPVKDFMRSWPRVSLCFVGTDKLRNPRQEIEREDAIRLSKARAKAGLKGGKSKAIANHLPEVCLSKGSVRAYDSVSVSESGCTSEEKNKEEPQRSRMTEPDKDAIVESIVRALAEKQPNPQDYETGVDCAIREIISSGNRDITVQTMQANIPLWWAAMREGRVRTKPLRYVVTDRDYLRPPPVNVQRKTNKQSLDEYFAEEA